MNFIEAAIFILLVAILSVPLANRFRLPLEIFLVIGSCVLSMTPGLPSVQINPLIVFDIFLPPILFSAAYFTSWRDFKFNLRPITQLAFGLVIFTTLMVAVIAKCMIPGFTWAESFLLGAIVSPTDASAATSIIKKLGAPRRIIAILEGESLINDASALVLYRFSLAAILYQSFSFTAAVGEFFLIAIGGVFVGIAVGLIATRLLKKLQDVQAETTFTFITAFSSYLIAEHFGFSGVISTVVCGLYFGLYFPRLAATPTRLNAKASWATLLFVINGFVFTLIGFQLPTVIKNLGNYSISSLVLYGSLVSLTVILLRVLWIYPSAYLPRLLFPSIQKKDPMPPWQFLFAIGWTGMRGIVSLAAVLAIPHTLPNGQLFPHLDLLIFITYCVIFSTLVVPTLTLPSILRFLHLAETHDVMREEAVARMSTIKSILTRVTELAQNENISSEVLNEFKKQMERRSKVIETQLSDTPYSMLNNDYFAMKKLTQTALKAERESLHQMRTDGDIHEEVYMNLIAELDVEEIRLQSIRI